MAKAIVSMRLSDGSAIDQWTSVKLRDTFTDPLGSYDFELRPMRGRMVDYYERLQKGELVGIRVNDVTQGSYIVVSRNVRVDKDGGTTISLHCESVLHTPYHASVNPYISKAYKTDAPVSTVVLEALAPYGFTELTGDANAYRQAISGKPIGNAKAATDVQALKHKDAQAQDGETAYAFCSRIFNRLGCALRVDHTGRLLLSAPDYEQSPSFTLVQDMSGANPGDRMVGNIDVEDTNDGQFSEVVVRGLSGDSASQTQSNQSIARVGVSGINATGRELFSTVAKVTDAFGGHVYTSEFAAPYKPKIIHDKLARDKKRAESVGKLVLGIAAAKAFVLSCTVDGLLSRDGRVWTVDTVANVIVEALNLREAMWILERCLTIDRGGGQQTHLKLIPLGALVLGDIPS